MILAVFDFHVYPVPSSPRFEPESFQIAGSHASPAYIINASHPKFSELPDSAPAVVPTLPFTVNRFSPSGVANVVTAITVATIPAVSLFTFI